MEHTTYKFSLGRFSCISVSDGGLNYPIEAFFANAPRNAVVDALGRLDLPTDRVFTPYTCLFVDTGQHRVMIDTGAGSLGATAGKMFPGIDHTTTATGRLLEHLMAAGIEPPTVDTVIITHAHPDHIGGSLDDAGNLVFPNARHVIARDEWEFWMSGSAVEQAPPVMADIARRNLEPARARLSLVDDGDEVVPGIRVIATPGHTLGHIALAITSGTETLLHVSDVVLHPLHLEHPDWVPAFDMLPAEAAASKRRMFDRAAEEEMLVFAHHFPPFPNLGHVLSDGTGWQWRPLPSAPLVERDWPEGQRTTTN